MVLHLKVKQVGPEVKRTCSIGTIAHVGKVLQTFSLLAHCNAQSIRNNAILFLARMFILLFGRDLARQIAFTVIRKQ